MTIIINNQELEITSDQMETLKKALNLNQQKLADVAIGNTCKIADIEFIHFGNGVVVTKESLNNTEFGDSNNLKESTILKKLEKEFLPKITKAVGKNNVLTFETDLTTVDGLKDYGVMMSKISLPTFDFYRENTEIFEKYKLDAWWWLATAWSTERRGYKYSVACVSPYGRVSHDGYRDDDGVRPLLTLDSSIFVTC